MSRTTLVLLPGMDGTGLLFEPLMRALGNEFDLRPVRYPGSGAAGYDELAALASAALPDAPYVILGESFSGPVAVRLASRRPKHLLGLVMCCTFISNPRPMLQALRPLAALLPVIPALTPMLSGLLMGRFATPSLRTALSQAIGQVSPSTLRARLAAVLTVDVSDDLEQVRVPVLCMRATSDRLVPRSACDAIVRARPGTAVVEFDAPHMLLQVVPDEAARTIGAFVRSLAGHA